MRIVLVLAVLLSFPISPSLSSNEKEAQDPMSEILDERKMENQLLAHFHRQAETKFEQGRSEASSLYRKATSTTSSPADYYTMGVIYYKGRGVRQSDEEALRWWARAAARHHAGAAYSIAVMHHNGRAGLSQVRH
jgi:TPR repeat protein